MPLQSRKVKVCPICKDDFRPVFSTQRVCGNIGCAIAFAKKKEAEKERKAFNARTKELRAEFGQEDRSKAAEAAQRAFNRFIRARDHGKPCISSGRPMASEGRYRGDGRIDAGHYRTIASAPQLRFNCWNVHAQSVHDNRDKSGNQGEYRQNLKHRIGSLRVAQLELDNSPANFGDLLTGLETTKAERARKLRPSRFPDDGKPINTEIWYYNEVKRLFGRRARNYRRWKGI